MFSPGVKRIFGHLFCRHCSVRPVASKDSSALRSSQKSDFSFFLWPLLCCRPFSLHIAYWFAYLLSPMTCFVATATCCNPPSVLIFFVGCHLCAVPQCTAVYLQPVLLDDAELQQALCRLHKQTKCVLREENKCVIEGKGKEIKNKSWPRL